MSSLMIQQMEDGSSCLNISSNESFEQLVHRVLLFVAADDDDGEQEQEEEKKESTSSSSSPKTELIPQFDQITSINCTGINIGNSGRYTKTIQKLLSLTSPNKLHSLSLVDCHLGRTFFTSLMPTTTTATSGLRELNVSHNPIGPRGARALATWLQKLQQQQQQQQNNDDDETKKKKKNRKGLKILNVSHCQLGHYGSQALAQYLPSSLTDLNLSHNDMQHDGVWKLADGSFHRLSQKLQKLDLSYNKLSNDGCIQVATHLTTNLTSLVELNLAGNNISSAGMENLADNLIEMSHQHYSVIDEPSDTTSSSRENIFDGDDEKGKAIGEDDDDEDECSIVQEDEYAFYAPTIGNQSPASAAKAAKNLGDNMTADVETTTTTDEPRRSVIGPPLRNLDLSDNPLGNDGAMHLGRSLHVACKFLKSVNVSKCDIENDAATSIAEALRCDDDEEENEQEEEEGNGSYTAACSNEFALDLSYNPLGDLGVGAFCEHLDSSPLTSLNLEGCEQVSESRRRILSMLLKHKQKQQQDASSNSLSNNNNNNDTPVAEGKKNNKTQQEENDRTMRTGSPTGEGGGGDDDEDEDAIEEGREAIANLLEPQDEDDESHCKIIHLSPSYIQYLTNDWDDRNILRHGAFGPLYSMRDDELLPDEDLPLIVRRVDLMCRTNSTMQSLREQAAQHALELRHEGFLPVVAAIVASQTTFLFVYNLAWSGAGAHHQQHQQHHSTKKTLRDVLVKPKERKNLSWKMRIELLRQVALALDHLHSGTVMGSSSSCVHGDIHPNNIYLSHDYSKAQLSDALLSRLVVTDRQRFANGDVVFSSRGYRCPRYERGSHAYDTHSEIFSFGIVLVEVLTGCVQRSKVPNSKTARDIYYDFILQARRQPLPLDPFTPGPALSRHATQVLETVSRACLSGDRDHRPSASTLSHVFESLENE